MGEAIYHYIQVHCLAGLLHAVDDSEHLVTFKAHGCDVCNDVLKAHRPAWGRTRRMGICNCKCHVGDYVDALPASDSFHPMVPELHTCQGAHGDGRFVDIDS